MPPVAALALMGAVAMLWMQRDEVEYFFSPREAIALGTEAEPHFERALHNRYAQVHGIPTLRGAYGVDRDDQHFVVVGLLNSPLLVKRRALGSEDWQPGSTPPPPDQRPFAAYGRLISRERALKWGNAFAKHDDFGEVKAKWLLVEGAKPGADFGAITWFGVLLAFAVINLWLLTRGVLTIVSRRRA